ncbi:hypothetical protein WR25_24903 [Diploscapter pachys]|uniref:Uncharacterized protein n=1 Tax=Diploscapter pachys TaxID=2018661 RepID=A0A2A2M2T7_9BILA|nr:hypothetical protein WR25_24903 [Diploscapter pachys]
MRLPSALANGRSRARAPVATMMCLAASSTVLSPCLTLSLPLPVSVPKPSTTVTLFFFIRPLTPALSCPATLRLRSTILPRSKPTLSAFSP